jgi:hypothetical protein
MQYTHPSTIVNHIQEALHVISEDPVFVQVDLNLQKDKFTVGHTGFEIVRSIQAGGAIGEATAMEVFHVNTNVVRTGTAAWHDEVEDTVNLHENILRLDKACVLLVQSIIGRIIQERLLTLDYDVQRLV